MRPVVAVSMTEIPMIVAQSFNYCANQPPLLQLIAEFPVVKDADSQFDLMAKLNNSFKLL